MVKVKGLKSGQLARPFVLLQENNLSVLFCSIINHNILFTMTSINNEAFSFPVALQLVPETILKKKHDLDEIRAQRASHLLMHPRNRGGGARDVAKRNSSAKLFKPETILAAARSKRISCNSMESSGEKGYASSSEK